MNSIKYIMLFTKLFWTFRELKPRHILSVLVPRNTQHAVLISGHRSPAHWNHNQNCSRVLTAPDFTTFLLQLFPGFNFSCIDMYSPRAAHCTAVLMMRTPHSLACTYLTSDVIHSYMNEDGSLLHTFQIHVPITWTHKQHIVQCLTATEQ